LLTKKGSEVLISLLAFFILSVLSQDPFLMVIAYSLILLFLLEGLIFRLYLKKAKNLLIYREMEENIYYGQRGLVKIKVEGKRYPLMVKVEDKLPDGVKLVKGSNFKDFEVGKEEWTYEIEALSLGKQIFEGLHLTFYDKLNLFVSYSFYPNPFELKVIPPLEIKIDKRIYPKFYLKLPKAKIKTKKLMTDLIGIRDYVVGDSYKLIAWKVMAKDPLLNPMTKEYEHKKIFDIVIALSTYINMKDGSLGRKKMDHVILSALNLAHLANRDGYKVGFAYLSKGKLKLEYGNVFKLSKFLSNIDIREENLDDLLIEELYKALDYKSLIFLITDLSYPYKLDFKRILLLKEKGHLLEILLLDPFSFLEEEPLKILKKIEEEHRDKIIMEAKKLGISLRILKREDLDYKLFELYNTWVKMSIP